MNFEYAPIGSRAILPCTPTQLPWPHSYIEFTTKEQLPSVKYEQTQKQQTLPNQSHTCRPAVNMLDCTFKRWRWECCNVKQHWLVVLMVQQKLSYVTTSAQNFNVPSTVGTLSQRQNIQNLKINMLLNVPAVCCRKKSETHQLKPFWDNVCNKPTVIIIFLVNPPPSFLLSSRKLHHRGFPVYIYHQRCPTKGLVEMPLCSHPFHYAQTKGHKE